MNTHALSQDKKPVLREKILRNLINRALDESEDNAKNSDGFLNFLGLKHVVKSKGNCFIQIFWSSIILACFLLCIYQIYDRIQYYLTNPVYIIVNLVEYANLTYPAITICQYHSDAVSGAMKDYVKGTDNKYCNVDMLDLLGTEKAKTVSSLWKLSKPKSYIAYFKRAIIFDLPKILEKNLYIDDVTLPQGICKEFKQKNPSFQYVGTLSVLPIYTVKNVSTQCRKSDFFLYPKEFFVNPAKVRYLPLNQASGLQLKLKIFKYKNTSTEPCVNISEASQCQKQCYNDAINERVSCWLPFMDRLKSSQDCQNVSSAKATRNIALDVFRKINPEKQCKCLRPCEKRDYQVVLESTSRALMGAWETFLYFPDNFIEEITEVEAYSGTKLLCDIGGNLGLYLGLSILALVDALQSLIYSARMNSTIKVQG